MKTEQITASIRKHHKLFDFFLFFKSLLSVSTNHIAYKLTQEFASITIKNRKINISKKGPKITNDFLVDLRKNRLSVFCSLEIKL